MTKKTLSIFLVLFFAGMFNIAGQAASNPPVLKDLLQTDYVLPGYLNRDQATLVLLPTPQLKEPIALSISFTHRFTNEVPTKPITVNLLPSKKIEVAIQIKNWPDGDYRTSIKEVRDNKEYGEEMVRWLRKQTIPSPTPPSEPIDLKGITMLFVDDWYLKEKEGLSFKVHPAEQLPIIESALEKDRILQSGTAVKLDPDGTFVVSFLTLDRMGQTPKYYTARSKDAVHWTITENQSRAKLPGYGQIVLAVEETITPVTYRLYDSAVDGPVPLDKVEIRYTGYERTKWGNIKVAARSRYAVWNKSPQENVLLSSKPIVTDCDQGLKEGEPGEWKDSNDNFGGEWLSKDNKTLFFCQARLIPRCPPFQIPYDNISNGNRILTVWRTSDGLNWTPTFHAMPTENDPVGWQHYSSGTFQVENKNLLLSYLCVYTADTQQIHMELAYSRDGILWQRFPGQPAFAPNGPFGSWNFGWIFPSGAPVEKEGMIYQFLGCNNSVHFFYDFTDNRPDLSQITPKWLKEKLEPLNIYSWPPWKEVGSWEGMVEAVQKASRTLGIMRYRKDGWVSISPEKEKGVLVTKTIKAGKTLFLNAKTNSGGSIKIEVLDDTGKPMGDYSGNNAAVFSGDSTGFLLAWKDGTVKELPQTPIRLRITLNRAELYALSWH